jgi:hypothetical protein
MNYKDTPQYNEYSSLNSLLMSSLYSENSRNLIIKKAKSWDNSNKTKLLIKKIVNKNKQKLDITNEISLINPDQIFLGNMYFLKDKDNQKKFVSILKNPNNNINYIKWIDDFIIDIYRSLGLSCLDIYKMKDEKFYINLYKYIFWKPLNDGNYEKELNINELRNFNHNDIDDISTKYDVLIIYHYDLNTSINNNLDKFSIIDNKGKTQNILSYFENQKININIEEEIEFNNNIYILDSILLKNGDKSIVGFRSDNEKYVYNNFSSSFNNPCSIIKFDWKYDNGEFCYNPFKCDLNDDITNIDDLCFDFKKGDKTLIYIKKDISPPIIPDISDEDILKIIKEIKQMDILKLIEFIKIYDSNIISSNIKNKIELEKIALRIYLINYLKLQKENIEQTEIIEIPQ